MPFYPALPGLLLPWYQNNARPLPWRETRDPYRVWVSEIMLQQTRVEAVLGYYARFLHACPDVAALDSIQDDALLRLWAGLGYYSRARNMKKAARLIMEEHGGHFPGNIEGLRALPGVGEYTAAAIGSICFALKTPAVDGNVLRVVSRLAAWQGEMTTVAVRRAVCQALASVCPSEAGAFSQAMMELGATVCLPNGAPLCAKCPIAGICAAHRLRRETAFPVKAEKKPRRAEERTVLLLTLPDGRAALKKRPERGLLAGLYEPPNELGSLTAQQALSLAGEWGVQPLALISSRKRTHVFTHIEWRMTCYHIACGREGSLAFLRPGDVALPGAFAPFF